MDKETLKNRISIGLPDAAFTENKQYAEMIIPIEQWHAACMLLKNDPELRFDYMISLTAVDWNDHFMLVAHLNSTMHKNTIVAKTRIEGRENLRADSLSDIWRTAEFHEREVFDLFGISFNNHPDPRRLFLEDDFGFPLRKDFINDARMIVR
jgi:NADH:ubiquinone oxidoreductase subunit C